MSIVEKSKLLNIVGQKIIDTMSVIGIGWREVEEKDNETGEVKKVRKLSTQANKDFSLSDIDLNGILSTSIEGIVYMLLRTVVGLTEEEINTLGESVIREAVWDALEINNLMGFVLSFFGAVPRIAGVSITPPGRRS
jgi:hypothetical protein